MTKKYASGFDRVFIEAFSNNGIVSLIGENNELAIVAHDYMP